MTVAEKLNFRTTLSQSPTKTAVLLDCMTLKMKGLRSFGKSGTTWPTTQHHIRSVATPQWQSQTSQHKSNKSYRVLAHLVHIKCDVPWNWKAWHSISNCDSPKLWEDTTGAPMSVRRVSPIQSYVIITSICLMQQKTATSQHLAHTWSCGRYLCIKQVIPFAVHAKQSVTATSTY